MTLQVGRSVSQVALKVMKDDDIQDISYDEITMLSDGNSDFTRQAGMNFDSRGVGLGWRSRRYSLLAKDGIVTNFNGEETPGECKISAGRFLLTEL